MTSLIKGKLKAAREALGKKDYETAKNASSQILDFEPDNYNACVQQFIFYLSVLTTLHRNVFLGLALLELGDYEKSEQVIHASV